MTQREVDRAASFVRAHPINPPAAGMEGPAVDRDEPWSFVRVDLPCIVAVLAIWCATWIAIGALS